MAMGQVKETRHCSRAGGGISVFEDQRLTDAVAFPQFNQKYGVLLPDGTYQITAAWQAGLSNVSDSRLHSHNSLVSPFTRRPSIAN